MSLAYRDVDDENENCSHHDPVVTRGDGDGDDDDDDDLVDDTTDGEITDQQQQQQTQQLQQELQNSNNSNNSNDRYVALSGQNCHRQLPMVESSNMFDQTDCERITG